jgi:hypothetical protein
MPQDAANTERFSAVIDLCEQIDEFVMNHDDTEDTASQQVLDAVGIVVGTVLHSIYERKRHAVTIDARFGVDGYDGKPLIVDAHPTSHPIRPELGSTMEPTSDDPVSQALGKLRDFIRNEQKATDNGGVHGLLEALSRTIGGIELATRRDGVADTLVCTEVQDGLVKVTAMPMRME